MAYSEDLRRRVVKYVREGGSKAEAARIYGVARNRVYAWLVKGDDLKAKKPGPVGPHKVDMKALSKLVMKENDLMLKEMAEIFGVHESTMSRAMKRMGMSRKKNGGLRGSKAL